MSQRFSLKKLFPWQMCVKVFQAITLISFVLFSPLSLGNQKGLLVISDIDDTVKVANTENVFGLVYHGLFTERIYPGMDTLLQELIKGKNAKESGELVFMTNSPEFLRKLRTSFMSGFPFPAHELVLRDWYKYSDPFIYKTEEMSSRIMKSSSDVVLIGDDTEKDHFVFEELIRRYPNRISSAYIHEVTGRPVSPKIRKYTHSLEIAMNEMRVGHLLEEQVLKVAESIENHKPEGDLIPDFKVCPSPGKKPQRKEINSITGLHIREKIMKIYDKIIVRLNDTCKERGDD